MEEARLNYEGMYEEAKKRILTLEEQLKCSEETNKRLLDEIEQLHRGTAFLECSTKNGVSFNKT